MCLTVLDGVEHSAEGAGGWRTRSGRLVLGGSCSSLRETLRNHIHGGSRMTGAVAGDLSVNVRLVHGMQGARGSHVPRGVKDEPLCGQLDC